MESPTKEVAVTALSTGRSAREAEMRATDVLQHHRGVLDRVVELLQAKETIDGSEIYALAGRPEPVGAKVVGG